MVTNPTYLPKSLFQGTASNTCSKLAVVEGDTLCLPANASPPPLMGALNGNSKARESYQAT
jgi:hypothetical protein